MSAEEFPKDAPLLFITSHSQLLFVPQDLWIIHSACVFFTCFLCAMFHKPGSSDGGKKKKKTPDVPLRKSDRKALRNRASRVLLSSSDTTTHPQSHSNNILDAAFLQGSLISHRVQLAEAKAILYIRSGDETITTTSDGQPTQQSWPYSSSPQCVWIQLDSKTLFSTSATSAVTVDVPGLALLALFTATTSNNSVMRLPTVWVASSVSKYLCRGANLMRAGMREIVMPSSSSRDDDDDDWTYQRRVVAVAVQGNPQPFAVGLLAPDLLEQKKNGALVNMGVGAAGVGVRIVTCYGDDLWRKQTQPSVQIAAAHHDDYGNAGFIRGEVVLPIVEQESGDDNEGNNDPSEDDSKVVEDEKSSPPEEQNAVTESTNEPSPVDASNTALLNKTESSVETKNDAEMGEKQEGNETNEPTPEEILHSAVCKALVALHPKKQLPMLISTFYASHVLRSRPTGTTIELKRTRFKKFGNYVAEQVNAGLLEVGPDASKKDPRAMLTGYDRRHPDLREYIAQAKASPESTRNVANRRLVLVDLYCFPSHFQSLLRLDPDLVKASNASSEERKGTGMLTAKEVGAILDGYIQREQLLDPKEPRMIVLDGPLTDALFGKKKKQHNEAPLECLPRKEVVARWKGKLQDAFALVELPDNRIVRLGRGKPPVVSIEVSMRQSRKFVTRVRGLENFGLDARAVCKDVSHRFACSGSAEENPENRAALPTGHVELVFQGNLASELEALLLGDDSLTLHGGAKDSPYRLPKNAIESVLRKGVPARKKKAATKKQK